MGTPFNPYIPGDYARALDRLERLKYRVPPVPRYPWPTSTNKRIKQLEAENFRLRTQAEETETQADGIFVAWEASQAENERLLEENRALYAEQPKMQRDAWGEGYADGRDDTLEGVPGATSNPYEEEA